MVTLDHFQWPILGQTRMDRNFSSQPPSMYRSETNQFTIERLWEKNIFHWSRVLVQWPMAIDSMKKLNS